MRLENFNTYFFFAVLIIVSAAAFYLFLPFVSAIFIAALFAAIFATPQRWLKESRYTRRFLGKSPAIVATIMCVFVALVIVLPIIGIGNVVISEITDVVEEATTEGSATNGSIKKVTGNILDSRVGQSAAAYIENTLGVTSLDAGIGNIIASAGDNILSLAQGAFSGGAGDAAQTIVKKTYEGIIGTLLWTFVMFFTLFYFFIDGRKFVKKIMALSPLRDAHEELLIEKFLSMARATLKGTFIIGGVQGSIGGLAFLIAGISSPMLWMVIMIFLSIIPALGAGLVIFPAGFIMLFLGHTWQGIFLLCVGAIVASIDNIMRPKLVGNDTQMHSLIIFFGTIGGISVFGIIGFIVGPIILALAIAMWEIYAHEFKVQLARYNK